MNEKTQEIMIDPSLTQKEQAFSDQLVCLAKATTVYNAARQKVPAAVAQLQRSERGVRALAAFRRFGNRYGAGLDTKNWQALSVLCTAEGHLNNDNT